MRRMLLRPSELSIVEAFISRLYMSAGAYGFHSGAINIVQTLLSKPGSGGRSGLPLTREDLYRG